MPSTDLVPRETQQPLSWLGLVEYHFKQLLGILEFRCFKCPHQVHNLTQNLWYGYCLIDKAEVVIVCLAKGYDVQRRSFFNSVSVERSLSLASRNATQ